MTALAKRLVACKHFHWKGMRAVGRKGSPDAWFRVEEPLRKLHGDWKDALPDLADPGTLGCLLALVREAWGDPLICTANGYPTLRWWVEDGGPLHRPAQRKGPNVPGTLYRSEAEALVAALEAAP